MKRLHFVLLFGLAACGSSTTATTTFTGTVGGLSFTPVEAVYAIAPASTGASKPETLIVALSDATGVCARMTAKAVKENSKGLILTASAADLTSHVTAATYTAGGTNHGQATFAVSGASCYPTPTAAASGSIVITSVDATTTSVGTFDLTFGTDVTSGKFKATYCADLLGWYQAVKTGTATCQ